MYRNHCTDQATYTVEIEWGDGGFWEEKNKSQKSRNKGPAPIKVFTVMTDSDDILLTLMTIDNRCRNNDSLRTANAQMVLVGMKILVLSVFK